MELRRSEDLGELAKALAIAQGGFQPILKTTNNPYYNKKYADLSALIEATRPALCAQGLVVIQTERVISGKAVEVTTMLLHTSNQFIAYDLILPAYQDVKEDFQNSRPAYQRFDAQTIGSAITYGRRYSYASILCIAAEDDDDGNSLTTNGNGASKHETAPAVSSSSAPSPSKPNGSVAIDARLVITQSEHNAFWSACKRSGKTKEQVFEYLSSIGVNTSNNIQKKDFASALSWALEAA